MHSACQSIMNPRSNLPSDADTKSRVPCPSDYRPSTARTIAMMPVLTAAGSCSQDVTISARSGSFCAESGKQTGKTLSVGFVSGCGGNELELFGMGFKIPCPEGRAGSNPAMPSRKRGSSRDYTLNPGISRPSGRKSRIRKTPGAYPNKPRTAVLSDSGMYPAIGS